MIRCGHCKESHDTIAQVRLCSHRQAANTTDTSKASELRGIQADLEQELQQLTKQAGDDEVKGSWPGYCQACGAPLDPPNATSCKVCGADDIEDD